MEKKESLEASGTDSREWRDYRVMNAKVKRLINHIEYLKDEELMQVIDALVATFEKRKADRLSPPQTPEGIVT